MTTTLRPGAVFKQCGHDRTPENSVTNGQGYDRCRTCKNNTNRQYQRRVRQLAQEATTMKSRTDWYMSVAPEANDIVTRKAPDPAQVAALENMAGKEVAITITYADENGVHNHTVPSAVLFSTNGNRGVPDME